MKTYQPINCNQYDKLEALATLQKKVVLVYQDKNGLVQQADTQIQDIFTKNGVEYLSTKQQLTIRLDQLLSIDGTPMATSCSI